MNERVSERLKELYKANGNKMVVTELRGNKSGGNEHEVYLSDDGTYFYSKTALHEKKLPLVWFDGIVDFIEQNGGEVIKGSCYCKIGTDNCTKDTLAYYIATKCYLKNEGESANSPISIIAAILDTAGICENIRKYISIKR